MKLYDTGVYLLNGQKIVPENQADFPVSKEEAAKSTIAYSILKAHNTSGNMEKLHKSNQIYNMYIHYVSDPILIDRLNCTKEKLVFGKKYNVIFPRMYVVHDHYLTFEQKRINNEMIKKLYIKVIEIKFEKFIKKIKNSVDIPNILW